MQSFEVEFTSLKRTGRSCALYYMVDYVSYEYGIGFVSSISLALHCNALCARLNRPSCSCKPSLNVQLSILYSDIATRATYSFSRLVLPRLASSRLVWSTLVDASASYLSKASQSIAWHTQCKGIC